jgi:hypothetical protein
MAKKKKEEEPIIPKPAANTGDAVASGLFGGALFNPIGDTFSAIANNMGSAPNPAMMAGAAGTNPLVASGVPQFPSRIGPLISTNYGLPPSERPDFRDPSMQWDARPVTPAGPPTVGSGRTISTNDAIAANLANMSDYDKGFYGALMRQEDFRAMPQSSQSIVETARSPLSGINTMQNTSIQGISVDRSAIAPRMPQNTQSFSTQPSFNLASSTRAPTLPSQPQPLQSSVPNIPQAVKPALTKLKLPSGEARVTAEQLKNYQTATARQEQEKQTKAENMSRVGQALTERKADLKEAAKLRDEESMRRAYSFQQRIADERAARETAKAQAEKARGGSGRDALRRAQRFEVEANLAEQRGALVGKTVKNPVTGKMEPARAPFFSNETITTRKGNEYLPSGMGEYIQTKQAPLQQTFGSPYSPFSASMEGFSQSPFAPSWMRGRKRFSNFGIS